MMSRIPVFEAKIEDITDGIMAIALVDSPAVESNFMVFNKDDRPMQKFSIQDEEQHIITGVVMRNGFPIYRYDEQFGEYFIYYSADTIKLMAEKMMEDDTFNKINIMHDNDQMVSGVNLIELFIKDTDKGISPVGFEDIENGSLFATYKVNNDDIWKEIKEGTFRGLSLQGYFSIIPTNKEIEMHKDKNSLRNIMAKLFSKFLKSLVKCESVMTDKGEIYWVGDADLEIGDEIFYDKGEEIIKVEDGDYKLEDGTVITVKEGLVSAITKANGRSEGELGEFAKKNTGCEEEVIVEEPKEETVVEEPKDEKYDELKADIDDLRKEHDELKGMYEDMKNALDAILNKPAAEPIVEEFNKVSKEPQTVIPKFGSKSRLSK